MVDAQATDERAQLRQERRDFPFGHLSDYG
jgi:hypothetical protein